MSRVPIGGRRIIDLLVVMAVAVPFLPLVLQALADRWQGRALVPQAVGWRGVRLVVDDPTLLRAVSGSLGVGAVVALVAVPLAWPAARYLAQSRSPAAWALLAAPLLAPPLVMGDGLAAWLPAVGLGAGYAAVVIAHLPASIAYAALALVPAFGPELDELDTSAAVLGAPPVRRLVDVVLPSARRHLVLALAMAFTVSWSQYGTSLTVGGGRPMLPLILVPFVRRDPQVAAVLTLMFLTPPAVTLAAAARAAGHRRASTAEPATAATAINRTKAGLAGCRVRKAESIGSTAQSDAGRDPIGAPRGAISVIECRRSEAWNGPSAPACSRPTPTDGEGGAT